MADDLRAKLKRNTVPAPAKRTAETFLPRTNVTAGEVRNKSRTTFYLPEPIRRGLKLTAAAQGTTVNHLVLTAIHEYLGNHPETAQWFTPGNTPPQH